MKTINFFTEKTFDENGRGNFFITPALAITKWERGNGIMLQWLNFTIVIYLSDG
ncbi:hypothetical protein ES705_28142 [subsurface metagenome]